MQKQKNKLQINKISKQSWGIAELGLKNEKQEKEKLN